MHQTETNAQKFPHIIPRFKFKAIKLQYSIQKYYSEEQKVKKG